MIITASGDWAAALTSPHTYPQALLIIAAAFTVCAVAVIVALTALRRIRAGIARWQLARRNRWR